MPPLRLWICAKRGILLVYMFIQYQDYVLLCFQTTTITTDRQHTSGWNGFNNTTTIIPLQTTPNYAALKEAFLTAFDPQKGMIFDSQVSTDFPLKLEYLRAVGGWSIPQVLMVRASFIHYPKYCFGKKGTTTWYGTRLSGFVYTNLKLPHMHRVEVPKSSERHSYLCIYSYISMDFSGLRETGIGIAVTLLLVPIYVHTNEFKLFKVTTIFTCTLSCLWLPWLHL